MNSVAAVLLGDVIGKFDVLQMHAAQNGMNRTQNGTHNTVNNRWVTFKQRFELTALQDEYFGGAD